MLSGEGRRSKMYTASPLIRPLRRFAAYRDTSLRSWFQKGFRTHSLLRTVAPRLIGAVRFARGLKKMCVATLHSGLSVLFASLVVSNKIASYQWGF